MIVIVGAGPVGLWLAAELRLGGAEVTVLEDREEPDPHSKALTVHPRTLELLACRGIVDRFLDEGRRIPDGHFGGLDDRMDFGVLDTPFPFTLALPQARTEALLEEHARAAGARILRGHRVTGLTGDEEGVTVEVAGRPRCGPRTSSAATARAASYGKPRASPSPVRRPPPGAGSATSYWTRRRRARSASPARPAA